ncbi:MAG: prepilin-type N-terminal cleavage/methylation domain-containing protein [Thermodesulfobacteriota bacterium]
MRRFKDQKGFTLTEILVATAIMALGFLAAAQMEFMALRQKQLAESGSQGINLIQYISDYDFSELRRLHRLNSLAFLKGQAGNLSSTDFLYCDGTPPSTCPGDVCSDPCSGCPAAACNPFEVVTTSFVDGGVVTMCSAVDLNNFDPTMLSFGTDTQCAADAAAMLSAGGDPVYVVRQATTEMDTTVFPNLVDMTVLYAVKNRLQFDDTGTSSLDNRDSMATLSVEMSAHIDNWSLFIPGWTQVWIPHVP